MAHDPLHTETGHDLVIRILQLKLSARLNRAPVLRQVTGAVALVRRLRMLKLFTRNEITRVGESRNYLSASLIKGRVAARVIEMQMRIDDDGDSIWAHAGNLAQGLAQRPLALDAVHLRFLFRPLVPDARLDEDALRFRLDVEAVHA